MDLVTDPTPDQVDALDDLLLDFSRKVAKAYRQDKGWIDAHREAKAKLAALLVATRQQAIASYKKVNDFHEAEIRIDELNRLEKFRHPQEVTGNIISVVNWYGIKDRIKELQQGNSQDNPTPKALSNKADNLSPRKEQ